MFAKTKAIVSRKKLEADLLLFTCRDYPFNLRLIIITVSAYAIIQNRLLKKGYIIYGF